MRLIRVNYSSGRRPARSDWSLRKKRCFWWILTYLKLTGCRLGLLINFGAELVKNGISRVVNDLLEKP